MKKTLLSLAFGLIIASSSFSQNITINLSGTSNNISGQTHLYDLASSVNNYHLVDFLYNNESQTGQPWIITRRIVNEPAGWSNYFCWGVNGLVGNCYQAVSDEYFDSGLITVPSMEA